MAAKKPRQARTSTRTRKAASPNGRPQRSKTTIPGPQTIGRYLIARLYELGIRHVFGIPGDYVLSFYKMLEESPIRVIGTTREDKDLSYLRSDTRFSDVLHRPREVQTKDLGGSAPVEKWTATEVILGVGITT